MLLLSVSVSRIVMKGENDEMVCSPSARTRAYSRDSFQQDLILDINCELYKVAVGTKLHVLLAKTLNLDGTADEKYYNQVRCAVNSFH